MRRDYVFLETRAEDLGDRAVAYVDTTGTDHAHAGPWIHLSHWYPNETPAEYRADTSTEIALRFAIKNPDHDFLPVNDHGDTDGVLSIFALVEPDLAAAHYDTVVGAAEVGDFSFWSSAEARRLYCALSEVRTKTFASQGERLAACLDRVHATLTGEPLSDQAQRAIEVLDAGAELLADAARTELTAHFVAYTVANDDQLGAVTNTPRFDEHPSSPWLSHRVRNACDRERLQLLSVPSADGWHHTVWYPQYIPWDTNTLWRMPGIEFTGDRLTWRCVGERVLGAVSELDGREPAAGWAVTSAMAPFAPDFPVLLAGPRSSLGPDIVGPILAEALPS